MALRASGEVNGESIELEGINDHDGAARSGVPAASLLSAFAEAVVQGDEQDLAKAREALGRELGPEALVDSAAIASNFQRMVRIADGTGIPLDTPMQLLTSDFQSDLGLDRFASAGNTPEAGIAKRVAGSALRGVLHPLLRFMGRRQSSN